VRKKGGVWTGGGAKKGNRRFLRKKKGEWGTNYSGKEKKNQFSGRGYSRERVRD